MNAKELLLSKLNAGTKTIGMYIYGVSIGMDFKDISDLMTSEVGWLLTDLTKSNIFTGENGIFSIDKVFDYIENGPRDLIKQFDEINIIGNKIVKSPVAYLAKVLSSTKYEKGLDPYDLFCKFAWDINMTLEDKLNKLESLKGTYSYVDTHGKLINEKVDNVTKLKFNQCVEVLLNYIRQVNIVKNNRSTYNSLLELAEGGEEFRVLGQILGLNQGLKTKPEEMMQKVYDIQNCIQARSIAIKHKIDRKAKLTALLSGKEMSHSKSSDISNMFDIVKFVFDKDYQQEQINKYDEVKHSVNILDVAMTVPHFAGYVQTLATDYKISRTTSHKFDTMVTMGEDLINKLKVTSAKDKLQVFKGIGNYYSDYVRRAWMLETLPPIEIPQGTKTIFNGKVTDSGTQIVLGTDEGDAAFKYLMENEIIPNLLKGYDGEFEGLTQLKDNKFIRDLSSALLTSTVTHNPIIYYALPINMLPSTDEERAVFNSYKAAFNKIAGSVYKLNGVEYPIADLFYYYGLIAHYGKQGRQSLMPIFENLHTQSNFKLLSFHAYESLFNETISTDPRKIYPYVLKTQTPYTATSSIIYSLDPDSMVTEIWEKQSRNNYKSDIEDLAKNEEISLDLAWYRIQKDLKMINEYKKIANSTLRNSEINNYFMITSNAVDDNFIMENQTGSIQTSQGEVKLTVRTVKGTIGNEVRFNKGYVPAADISGHSELLTKYPVLLKVPVHKVNGTWKIDIEKYAELLNLAFSEENNECNIPY